MNSPYKNLVSTKTSTKPFRRGKGIGSGKGKTSGKGHKGQRARSGKYNLKVRGYGSQTSFSRLLPKKGFKSQSSNKTYALSFSALAHILNNGYVSSDSISEKTFIELGLVKKGQVIKVIMDNVAKKLDTKLTKSYTFSNIIFSSSVKNVLLSLKSSVL